MNMLAKVLIGTAAVAGVGAIIAIAAGDEQEEKKVVTTNESGVTAVPVTEEKEEDQSVLKKIKKFVKKQLIRALGFVVKHIEQVQAVGAVIGLAGTVISIAKTVRDFAKASDTDQKLDEIEQRLIELDEKERRRANSIGTYVEEFWRATDHNLNIINENVKEHDHYIGYTLDAVAEKVGLNIDQLVQDREEARVKLA